ncbi:MAG: TIGR00296 family protein [archaeon]|nr:TIGR00296 family protein [archaeon]
MLTQEDGDYLLKIAKEAIETFVKTNRKIEIPSDCPNYMKEDLGVFVTLNKNQNLRGCIGYPEPIMPLINAIIDSAISAAVRDPRFPQVSENELEDLDYEITVLTKPQLIEVKTPEEYPTKVNIGEDGLIVEKGFFKGLLLPQVATEYNMSSEEFLSHTCIKAGIRPNAWLNENVEVYKFQGQIFK